MSASDNINEDYGDQYESQTDGGEDEKNENDMEAADEWNNDEDDTLEDGSNDDNEADMFQVAVSRLFDICCGQSLASPDELERLLQDFPEAVKTRCHKGMLLPVDTESIFEIKGLYPLHMACWRNAPISVVRALLNAWPEAVQAVGDYSTPLHCACLSEHNALIKQQMLVQARPGVLQEKWNKQTNNESSGGGGVPSSNEVDDNHVIAVGGLLPLHTALDRNSETVPSLPAIQFLVSTWPDSCQVPTPNGMLPLHGACANEKVSIFVMAYLVDLYPAAL